MRPFSLGFVPSFLTNGQKERRAEIKTVGRRPFCTSRRHQSTKTVLQPFTKLLTTFCPYLATAVNFVLSRPKNYVRPSTTTVTSGPTTCINEQRLIFLRPRSGNLAIFFHYTAASILAPAEGREGGDSTGYCLAYRITWPSLWISQLSIHFLLPSAVRLWIYRVLTAIYGLQGHCAACSGNALPTFRNDPVKGFLTLEDGTDRLYRNVRKELLPSIYPSGFITAVAVFRKPNAIPLCFSIDLFLNFVLSGYKCFKFYLVAQKYY